MKKIPWFKFNPMDYMNDENVKLMCLEAKGLYVDMLCHCWENDGMPDDNESIRTIFHLSKHKFNKLWKKISPCFFSKGERLFNHRQEKEKAELENYFEQKSVSGKKGAEKRWHTHNLANSEKMQDKDSDSDSDKEEYKSSEVENSVSESSEPLNLVVKNSQQYGLLISREINRHQSIFNGQSGNDSPTMKRLFVSLLSVMSRHMDEQKVLAYVIQAKESKSPKNSDERMALAISVLKAPKFAPADSAMKSAKDLLALWAANSDVGKRVASITPDLTRKM